MSGDKELDLAAIEARLKAAGTGVDLPILAKYAGTEVTTALPHVLNDDYDPILAPGAQKFVDHAPTDIAALIGEVKRLQQQNEHLKARLVAYDDFYSSPEEDEED